MNEEWKYDPETMNTTSRGNSAQGDFDQRVIQRSDFLFSPIIELLFKKLSIARYGPANTLYLVTEGRWTGYSSYTITSEWDEVHVHWGEYDLHYDSMGAFLADLAQAND